MTNLNTEHLYQNMRWSKFMIKKQAIRSKKKVNTIGKHCCKMEMIIIISNAHHAVATSHLKKGNIHSHEMMRNLLFLVLTKGTWDEVLVKAHMQSWIPYPLFRMNITQLKCKNSIVKVMMTLVQKRRHQNNKRRLEKWRHNPDSNLKYNQNFIIWRN